MKNLKNDSYLKSINSDFKLNKPAPTMQQAIEPFMKVTGLSHITQSGKWAFGMSVMGTLAEESGKVFSKLDKRLAKQLKKYGSPLRKR